MVVKNESRKSAPQPLPTIVFADALDTLLVNPPRSLPPAQASSVLVAGECSSFPRCYRELYAMRAPRGHVAACAARRREGRFVACYANSGAFAGRSEALLRLLPALTQRASSAVGVEKGDDQAAMHHFVARERPDLSGHPSQSPPSLRVDLTSRYFLSLYPCTPAAPAAPPGALPLAKRSLGSEHVPRAEPCSTVPGRPLVCAHGETRCAPQVL